MIKNIITLVIIMMLVAVSVDQYFTIHELKETSIIPEEENLVEIGMLSNIYSDLPDGYVIVTDGKVFRWKYQDYVCIGDYITKRDAINNAWLINSELKDEQNRAKEFQEIKDVPEEENLLGILGIKGPQIESSKIETINKDDWSGQGCLGHRQFLKIERFKPFHETDTQTASLLALTYIDSLYNRIEALEKLFESQEEKE